MPGLAFGLNASKPSSALSKPTAKRKAAFGADDASDDEPSIFTQNAATKKPSRPLKPLHPLVGDEAGYADDSSRPSKSPKLSHLTTTTNLAALRNARIQDKKVAEVDASVYDYDGAFDTFSAHTKKISSNNNGENAGPKYMGNLLASSEQRKRDQLRAKEKALQRERENEGDEFAGKEAFVTGAYKKQQEEIRAQEEEEKKRLELEDERRRKGMGMTDFNKTLLRKDEERQRAIEEAERRRVEEGVGDEQDVQMEVDENKEAKNINEKGGHVVMNDEGEVVDKRQLLSAGLNTAPKKLNQQTTLNTTKAAPRESYSRTLTARNAKEAQRERQSRMMERQLEEMAEKAKQAELEEEKKREQKVSSKITEEAKMDAKARYLARKKEREEAAAAAAAAKKDGGRSI